MKRAQTNVVMGIGLAMALLVGCSHKLAVTGDNRVLRAGVIEMWAPWVKDKGVKYDVQLNVSNVSAEPIQIQSGDVRCFRGASEGSLKNFGNSKVVELAAGQHREFTVHCDFDSERTAGAFRIQVGSVYASPAAAGKERGKLLAQDVELNIPESSLAR